jgi:hypothetical protein
MELKELLTHGKIGIAVSAVLPAVIWNGHNKERSKMLDKIKSPHVFVLPAIWYASRE